MKKKKISIYGSTGSIGTTTLRVIDEYIEKYEIMTLVAGSNIELFRKQLKKYKPKYAYIKEEKNYITLKKEFPNINFYFDEKGLEEISSLNESDIYVSALVGIVGLIPTINMIKTGKTVILANKEVIVTGGKIVMDLVEKHKTKLIPIDSEHSAITQCLNGENKAQINKILLTASGGPFLNKKIHDKITKEEALNHPTWKMGSKITIDSSTLMNKAFEIIEAKYLFNINYNKIEVVIHKQSLVHSMVEFLDGTIIANIAPKSMEIPISYALNEKNRKNLNVNKLDLFKIKSLNFKKPNFNKFKALYLAYYVLEKGHSYQIVLNAANEVLVNAFLNNQIKFTDIMIIIEKIVKEHKGVNIKSINDIISLDVNIRKKVSDYIVIK